MTAMPFGRHKGQPLTALPSDYLTWIAAQELKPPLRAAIDAEVRRRADGGPYVLVPDPAHPRPSQAAGSPPRRHQCPKCGEALTVAITKAER